MGMDGEVAIGIVLTMVCVLAAMFGWLETR